jgi:hypothetical protein
MKKKCFGLLGRRSLRRRCRRLLHVALLIFIGGTLQHLMPSPSIVTKESRVAYLITLDEKSNRSYSTKTVLEKLGFVVLTVHPPYIGESYLEKTVSNKLAFMKVFRKIKSGTDEWAYIFEDDVTLHKNHGTNNVLAEIMQGETLYGSLFQYVGLCKSTHTLALSINVSKSCGRCAHALGMSRRGVQRLLDYIDNSNDVLLDSELTPQNEPYMDAIIEAWCLQEGGFNVVGPVQTSEGTFSTHIGMFIQDRTRFPSTISTNQVV